MCCALMNPQCQSLRWRKKSAHEGAVQSKGNAAVLAAARGLRPYITIDKP